MKKNAKLTIILISCFALLFALGIFKLLIPKYNEIGKRADDNSAIAKEANEKLDMARGLNEKSINKRLKKLQARVPNSLELPNVILKLNDVANQAELIWLEGTPEDVLAAATIVEPDATSTVSPTAPQLDNHEVSIKVQGDINNLIKFLELATNKNVGRIIVIKSVTVTPVEATQDGVSTDISQISAEIKMNIIGWVEGADINADGCIENPNTPGSDCVNATESKK